MLYRITEEPAIPVERYFSREFFELERERLWPHVWQAACRLEEIPNVGDFTEYRIIDQSVLIVRETEQRVRAFFNACRHRAAALALGDGRFQGEQIVCPFHGWRWRLDGSNAYVYGEGRGFPRACLDPEELRLRECRVALRWGMVWIHMDPEAEAFETEMGGIAPVLDGLGLDHARVDWWKYMIRDANWKIAQEAFLEAYHIMQSHPELAAFTRGEEHPGEIYANYELDPRGHSWSSLDRGRIGSDGYGEWPVRLPPGMDEVAFYAHQNRVNREGLHAWITDRQLEIQDRLLATVPRERFFEALEEALREDALRQGLPLPQASVLSTGHLHVFPNTTMIVNMGNALIYKFRPDGDDPQSCIFDIWAVSARSAGEAPPRPEREGPIPIQDWPFILQQDIGNIDRQQIGLRTRGFGKMRVSPRYEPMILNMHRVLDQYLARPTKG
jgi:phenylpropionate dioxygenase-like ring-hydroxylating dioxygenase large terminal subunit